MSNIDGRGGPIAPLKSAILTFARQNQSVVISLKKGQKLIEQDAEGTDIFLIQEGIVQIKVKSPGGEIVINLRSEGDLIGETAILQRRGRRNATVEVASNTATLIRVSRQDVLKLVRSDSEIAESVTAVWELANARSFETQEVRSGIVHVETEIMSVLLADIHDFSMLGETVSEELSDAFLFEFIDEAQGESETLSGLFEDQGDGFKIVFRSSNHVARAVSCATEIVSRFHQLRTKWSARNKEFQEIGLGIGICTDIMAIRRKASALDRAGRITSHSMSVAAAMAKERVQASDTNIFLDENTAAMVRTNSASIGPPEERWLKRLNRAQILHQFNSLPPDRNYSVATLQQIPTTILLLAAEPTNTTKLRLMQEVRDIQETVRLSAGRDRFIFKQCFAVRPGDLIQGLLDHRPTIVHFSGHGSEEGLCLENEIGEVHLVSADKLTALFREFSPTLECVIMNACYSFIQAQAIAAVIKCVIGMQDAVSDGVAIAYAKGFYQALGAGKKLDEAHRIGCVRIGLEFPGANEDRIPTIKMRRD